MSLKSFLNAALDVLFPPLCHVCHRFIPDAGQLHICPGCRELFRYVVSPLCTVCGIPFVGAGDDHVCGNCITAHHQFDAARAALAYEGVCRDLIHGFKYRNKTPLRRPLTHLLTVELESFVRARKPDLIVPVPLHRKRLRTRGFNQAVLLADLCSKQWVIPFDRMTLRRTRWTEPQINLAASDRRDNVRGAFSVKDPARVSGLRVLLLDDVFTTGSTVDECALVLKRAGAVDVSVVTVARAL